MAPLAVAALALVAGLAGCDAGTAGTAAEPETVWPYYAETIAISPPAYGSPLNLSIRATATGDEMAALRARQPGESVGFVAGTGQPGRWIAGIQPWHPVGYDNSAQPARLYLATMTPATIHGETVNQYDLTPLPPPPMRASQLIDGTAEGSSVRQLAAATLSPDGHRLALVITQGDGYQVDVYPVGAGAATKSWSGQVNPDSLPFDWGFSLTWLGDGKTLAVGVTTVHAMAGSTAAVHYLNTAAASGSLAEASRTVTLSFPAGQAKTGPPGGCYGAPVATSDGQRVLCAGVASYPVTAGAPTEVGLWVFAARTGALTATWSKHTICCALSSTDFPRIRWLSPHGTLVIASGMSAADQGAQLFERDTDGTLRQVPWNGLTQRPGQPGIIEPSTAW